MPCGNKALSKASRLIPSVAARAAELRRSRLPRRLVLAPLLRSVVPRVDVGLLGDAAAAWEPPRRPRRREPRAPLAAADAPTTPCARRRCAPSAAARVNARPHSGQVSSDASLVLAAPSVSAVSFVDRVRAISPLPFADRITTHQRQSIGIGHRQRENDRRADRVHPRPATRWNARWHESMYPEVTGQTGESHRSNRPSPNAMPDWSWPDTGCPASGRRALSAGGGQRPTQLPFCCLSRPDHQGACWRLARHLSVPVVEMRAVMLPLVSVHQMVAPMFLSR